MIKVNMCILGLLIYFPSSAQVTGVDCQGFPFEINISEGAVSQLACGGESVMVWSAVLTQLNVLSQEGIDVSLEVLVDGVPQGSPGSPVQTVTFFAPDNDDGHQEAFQFPWSAVNPECSPMNVSFEMIIEVQCAALPAGSTYDGNGGIASQTFGPYDLIVYPEDFTIEEIPGSCDAGAMVNIYSVNGTECFSETGNVPQMPACDEVDSEDLNYTWSTNFPVCNQTFAGSIEASCTAPACIPTLGQWALLCMTFLFLIFGLISLNEFTRPIPSTVEI